MSCKTRNMIVSRYIFIKLYYDIHISLQYMYILKQQGKVYSDKNPNVESEVGFAWPQVRRENSASITSDDVNNSE